MGIRLTLETGDGLLGGEEGTGLYWPYLLGIWGSRMFSPQGRAGAACQHDSL